MPTARDVTGHRFGRLTAVRFLGNRRVGSQSKRFWLMRCDCGAERELAYSAFASGATASCGCLLRETITKHGASGTQTYRVWHAMIQRCRNPQDPSWADYGGRGITVCDRWRDYAVFMGDMGPRPRGATLEREDVDGGYSPENCRWATPREQANNRRTNRLVTYQGATRTLADWARAVGLRKGCLQQRIAAGWPVERALTQPADRSRQHRV